jgi:hypothetical protein
VRLRDDAQLDKIPWKDRERLAIHNLAKLNDARHKIAALLDCDLESAESKAIKVRDDYYGG